MAASKNVLGDELASCSCEPLTGFFRDGCCNTGPADRGLHTVCVRVTEAFLEFTRAQGNDLSSPIPAAQFPGLRPGDRWCLCAARWKEAADAGVAPPVILEASHAASLRIVPLEQLREHAIPAHPAADA